MKKILLANTHKFQKLSLYRDIQDFRLTTVLRMVNRMLLWNKKLTPPEIDYLLNEENGLILPVDERENNIKKILRLLTDDTYYSKMSAAAYKTAKQLTLENWVMNMRNALEV